MLKKRIYAASAAAGLLFGTFGGFGAWGDSPSEFPAGTFHAANAASVAAGGDPETNAAVFTDVPSDSWYYPYVSALMENGVVKGMTETEFVPQGTFTVAESAAIITRYLGLESEAADRKNAMEILHVAGSDKWYAGYLQLMYEAGIIDVTQYGCSVLGRHISIDSYDLLEAPVKRYEFAAFVTRSFELDGTDIRTGDGTAGHEFIFGGAYDESVLERYIPYIKDYARIPASYNYYVLKAYYNGIFNGDDFGNFNPDNNLTRAEMAKVTAVILDMSLRTRIDVSEEPGEILSEDCFVYKNGRTYLKHEVSDRLLQQQAAGVSAYAENNMAYVAYIPQGVPPTGYIFELYHFTRDKSGFDVNLAAETAPGTGYQNLYTPGDRVLLVLADKATGEKLDAYAVILADSTGTFTADACRYLP